MKINGNEIRPGNVIEHDGGLWVAVKTNAVKPARAVYNQVEPKNLPTAPNSTSAPLGGDRGKGSSRAEDFFSFLRIGRGSGVHGH
jgi:hypothetical protein